MFELNAAKLIEIVIIRSGKTQSGVENRYLSQKSEGLLPQEVIRLEKREKEGIYPSVARVYISSADRCQETAYIIYKNMPAFIVEGLNGFQYGALEGKTYPEAASSPQAQKSLLKKEPLPIMGGESPYVFTARVLSSFRDFMAQLEYSNLERVALVTHRTVIQTIIRRYAVPRSLYIGVGLDYGEGLIFSYDYDTGTGVVKKYI